MTLFNNLNSSQREAAEAPLMPIIVKAAAGTGKTTVLVERIVYLIIHKHINPVRILAVTFTNAVADNMRQKIREKIKNYGLSETPRDICTVHSLFVRIFESHLNYLFPEVNRFDVLENARLMNEVKEFNQFDKPNKDLIADYKKWRIDIFFGREEAKNHKLNSEFSRFKEYLLKKGKFSFDDVLLYCGELFKKDAQTEEKKLINYLKNAYDAVLVDECQDLTELQWHLIKYLIHPERPNFLVVGDPNQCIFLFAGSRENIFEEIESSFNNYKVISLTENYRFGPKIAELANSVRKIKTMPEMVSVVPMQSECSRTSIKTSDKLLIEIQSCYEKQELHKWVFLSRSFKNKKTMEILKKILDYKIPVWISTFEWRDFFWLFSLIRVSFFDNYYCLKQLFGDIFGIELPLGFENKRDPKRFLDILELNDDDLKNMVSKNDPNLFVKMIKKIKYLRSVSRTPEYEYDLPKFIDFIKSDPYLSTLSKKITIDFDDWSFLNNWFRFIQEYKQYSSEQMALNLRLFVNPTNREFLDLLKRKFNLMIFCTIHKAKGLEWDNVIVLDKELLGNKNKHEQNKHLPYVAYTRVKNHLYLLDD